MTIGLTASSASIENNSYDRLPLISFELKLLRRLDRQCLVFSTTTPTVNHTMKSEITQTKFIQPKLSQLLIASFLALGLPYGCDLGTQSHAENSTQDKNKPAAKVAATVNGTIITLDQVKQSIASKKLEHPDLKQNPGSVLDELISIEVLKQQAAKSGIAERPDVIAQLNQQRTSLLINTMLRDYASKLSFTDDQLRNEYDKQIAKMSAKEYKARHILTQSKEDAQQVIKDLDGGADFVELAKTKSTGPSGPKGGDLGWFTTESMVPPFAQAVKNMTKGSYNHEPVQTQFGWHVILLEDQRDVKAPSFEQTKDKLRLALTNQALQDYIEQLRKAAQIEIKSGS